MIVIPSSPIPPMASPPEPLQMADSHTESAPANDNGGRSVGRQSNPEVVSGKGGDFNVSEASASGEYGFLESK